MALKLNVATPYGPAVVAGYWIIGSVAYDSTRGAIDITMAGYPDQASAEMTPPPSPIMARSYSVNAAVLPDVSAASVYAYVQTLPDWAGATTVADAVQTGV